MGLASLPIIAYGVAPAVYWLAVTALVALAVYHCYEFSPSDAAFRAILGYAHESIVTTVVRYLVVMMWLPELPERYPVAYILLTLMIYAVMCYTVYRLLARRLQRGGTELDRHLGPARTHVFSLLGLALIMYATNGICEWVIPTMENDPALQLQFELIRYFCIGIRLLVGTVFLVSHYYIYENGFLLCANRGIRLTCTAAAKEIGKAGVIDLYTMLSNALDNAIECVEQLADPEKKTISFSVTERGRMLLIEVENYYEGTIQMRGGFPVTHKADKENHGIGVRSIHTLAKRYGGDIRISVENQIFLLQIMLST